MSYRATFLCANLSSEYKTAKSLNEFKPKIKEQKHILVSYVKNIMKTLHTSEKFHIEKGRVA